MNTGKIQSLHYERMAYAYVRQSTPWQVTAVQIRGLTTGRFRGCRRG
jgi:hypothetical protein